MIKKLITYTAIAFAASSFSPLDAASAKSLEDKYSEVYHQVRDSQGKKASGRNIRKEGVPTKSGEWRKPKGGEYSRAIRALRLLAPNYTYLAKSYSHPYLYPGKIPTARLKPVGLAACITHYESTNNVYAQNKQYKGLAQWSPEAWARHGGLRFAPTPHGANWNQQLIILNNGLTKFGCRDWCPFDPC